jgi:phosphoglycolate phosphatase
VLDALKNRHDVICALLTGNYEPIARMKLKQARIGRFFSPHQGAFGSDAEDRADLPFIARRRAGGPKGHHPRERTVVLGDTPRDIACARADEVRVIGISTGPHAAEELAEADVVVPDARGAGRVLEGWISDPVGGTAPP